MTRKQFFKRTGLDQPRHKKPFLDLIKKYKGRLPYWRLYMLIYVAIRLGRRGPGSIISYIEAVMDSEVKERKK